MSNEKLLAKLREDYNPDFVSDYLREPLMLYLEGCEDEDIEPLDGLDLIPQVVDAINYYVDAVTGDGVIAGSRWSLHKAALTLAYGTLDPEPDVDDVEGREPPAADTSA